MLPIQCVSMEIKIGLSGNLLRRMPNFTVGRAFED